MEDGSELGRDPDAEDTVDDGRRAALVKMGRYAGLTAPAVITLLTVEAPMAWAGSAPVGSRPRNRPGLRILRRIFG